MPLESEQFETPLNSNSANLSSQNGSKWKYINRIGICCRVLDGYGPNSNLEKREKMVLQTCGQHH